MKDASIHIQAELTKRGYRVTQARVEIATLLAKAAQPLTIQSLCQQAKSDEVSVYRTIALFMKEGFVEEVPGSTSGARFALRHGHHHHVVCTTCEKVVHIEGGTEPSIPKKIPGFAAIVDHELTFFGTCNECV
jgi:Fur family transcriptional regulator, ferric uptake regulator